MDKTAKHTKEKISAGELRDLLSSNKFFSDLPDAAYVSLAAISERVFLPAGERIISDGEMAKWAFIIEHGRLRIVLPDKDQVFKGDIGRGEVGGLISVLTKEPVTGDFYALRDSKVVLLRVADLLRCMTEHQELIVAYSRYTVGSIKILYFRRGFVNRPQAFTFLPVNEDPSIGEAVQDFYKALSAVVGPGSLINRRILEDHLGQDISEKKEFERIRPRLTAWCESQEADGRFLLFVCDPHDTSWTRWCLQQTDRIVVAARAGAIDEIERIDSIFAGHMVAGSEVKVDLLLLHNRDAGLPSGMGAWMDLKCLHRFYHVRKDNVADFQRAARRMSERAVGVVLGGGGARGLAHIGVLQALEEAGIPVDAIGGTSMGSVMAAAYARGMSPERILKMASKVFTDPRAVRDLDFPMISILGGHKLDKTLQSLFKDSDIADLWLPYFCISSSLTDGHMMVHDRGPLWRSVRASCSLPGIFPPVQAEGNILVDGGIMNNVPMDIMGTQCAGGTVIAVDVGGGGARDLDLGNKEAPSGWNLLLNRLNPASPNERIANIFQILLWSTTLSSKQYLQQLLATGHVDLFLTPPVQEFQLLGFEAYQRLYEIGYEYTRKRLAEWDCLEQVVAGGRCES
jgi:predicted acylesterase/phospholipase RssA